MPSFQELQSRVAPSFEFRGVDVQAEESLIDDARSQMTPSDVVEQKLHAVLKRVKTLPIRVVSDGQRRRKSK